MIKFISVLLCLVATLSFTILAHAGTRPEDFYRNYLQQLREVETFAQIKIYWSSARIKEYELMIQDLDEDKVEEYN